MVLIYDIGNYGNKILNLIVIYRISEGDKKCVLVVFHLLSPNAKISGAVRVRWSDWLSFNLFLRSIKMSETLDKIYLEISVNTKARNVRELEAFRVLNELYFSYGNLMTVAMSQRVKEIMQQLE